MGISIQQGNRPMKGNTLAKEVHIPLNTTKEGEIYEETLKAQEAFSKSARELPPKREYTKSIMDFMNADYHRKHDRDYDAPKHRQVSMFYDENGGNTNLPPSNQKINITI